MTDKDILLALANEIADNIEEGEYTRIYDTQLEHGGTIEVGAIDWLLVLSIDHLLPANPHSTGNILRVTFVPEHRDFEGQPTTMLWTEDTVASWEDSLNVIGEYIAHSL